MFSPPASAAGLLSPVVVFTDLVLRLKSGKVCPPSVVDGGPGKDVGAGGIEIVLAWGSNAEVVLGLISRRLVMVWLVLSEK
jgi:hypothetical protein